MPQGFFLGGPLILMELLIILIGVGAEVSWIINQTPSAMDEERYTIYEYACKLLAQIGSWHIIIIRGVNDTSQARVSLNSTWTRKLILESETHEL